MSKYRVYVVHSRKQYRLASPRPIITSWYSDREVAEREAQKLTTTGDWDVSVVEAWSKKDAINQARDKGHV